MVCLHHHLVNNKDIMVNKDLRRHQASSKDPHNHMVSNKDFLHNQDTNLDIHILIIQIHNSHKRNNLCRHNGEMINNKDHRHLLLEYNVHHHKDTIHSNNLLLIQDIHQDKDNNNNIHRVVVHRHLNNKDNTIHNNSSNVKDHNNNNHSQISNKLNQISKERITVIKI